MSTSYDCLHRWLIGVGGKEASDGVRALKVLGSITTIVHVLRWLQHPNGARVEIRLSMQSHAQKCSMSKSHVTFHANARYDPVEIKASAD